MGYCYNLERDYVAKRVWKCERTGSAKFAKCLGRCFTFSVGLPEIRKDHNHLPAPEKTIGLESICQILRTLRFPMIDRVRL